jgi:hypothetical protein
MKNIIIIATLFIAGNAYSQTKIDIQDVSKHVGDSVELSAKIYGGKYLENANGSPTLLNVGADYPNALLTLVVPKPIREQFFRQTPEIVLKGKECIIYGKIELYKEKPQIIIYNKKQIIEPVKVDID